MDAALRKPDESLAEAPFLGVARSLTGRRWVERLPAAQELVAAAIAQQNDLPDILGRVLAARGADAASAGTFLAPTLRTLLPDPASLKDMEPAAQRFADAICAAEPIALFGDYDVDGAASVALIERFLRAHGQAARIYIPDRLREGYGPSEPAMTALAEEGASLILTVDCGTSAETPIAAANDAGADVVVLDHHQAGEHLPQAFAIVNPNREDDLSGQGHLAAAGVVFLFLVATLRALRARGVYRDREEPDLLSLVDLVALATVCDVVPLKGLNRAFVTQGLKILHQRQNTGLRALADAARLDEPPSTYSLGYVLGPRINAGGRTGFSGLGTALLSSDDPVEAASLAERLETLNAERKAIEHRMLEEAGSLADAIVEAEPDTPVLCLAGEPWHTGLLGLVASRITERHRRPSLVIAWEGESGTGSARSIPGIDLGRAIRQAVDNGLLLRGGGHAMAAGFRLEKTKLPAFRHYLSEAFGSAFAAQDAASQLSIDGALSAGGATPALLALLDRAGPYGAGHPVPRFALPNHRISRVRLMKQAHIRCTLQAPDGRRLEACAFRIADTPLGQALMESEGAVLHIAGRLRLNRWQGRETIELTIDDAAKPQTGTVGS